MVVQDDAVPCPGFPLAAERAIEAKPDCLVSFFLQPVHKRGVVAGNMARDRGEHWVLLQGQGWLPAIAMHWPRDYARCALDWHDAKRASWPADDANIDRFSRECGVEAWATVPCLVEHPDDGPSIMNPKGTKGRTAVWKPPETAEEALAIDWFAGQPAARAGSLASRRSGSA